MTGTCSACGGACYSKAVRCRACWAESLRGRWRVADPGRNGGHRRARSLYRDLGACEHPGCDKPASDRHHRDGNTLNNDRSNLAFLCRRHHMLVDGRLDELAARASEAGRRGGNPIGRVNPKRDARGRYLREAA